MNEQDPARHHMQPPIPTHPPDPAEKGDEEKIVGAKPDQADDPTLHSIGLSAGQAMDPGVGGPGLGQPPQESNAAGTRDEQTRVDDAAGRA